MVLMMKMRGDNDDVQHDVKDDPIVDSRRRLEHNIMSSITGSRHNCEQGQAKPQLGGCTAHHNNETTERGGEAHHRRGGAGGGITWGGGGGRGVAAALHHICNPVLIDTVAAYHRVEELSTPASWSRKHGKPRTTTLQFLQLKCSTPNATSRDGGCRRKKGSTQRKGSPKT